MMARAGCWMVAVAVLCGGCQGEPDVREGEQNVKEARAAAIAQVKQVATLLDSTGEQVTGATGSLVLCGGGGLSNTSFRYAADANLAPNGDEAERIQDIADVMVSRGWKLEIANDAGEAPFAQLEREDLRATVKPATNRGGRLLGDGTLSIGFAGPCVAVSSEQDTGKEEPEQIIG